MSAQGRKEARGQKLVESRGPARSRHSAACAARQSEAPAGKRARRKHLRDTAGGARGVAAGVEAEGVRSDRAPAQTALARPRPLHVTRPCASAVAPARACCARWFVRARPEPRQAAQEAARARARAWSSQRLLCSAAAAAAAAAALLRPCCATQHSHAAMSFSMLNFSMACAAQSMESCCMSSLMSCGRARGCGERRPAGGVRGSGGRAAQRARQSQTARGTPHCSAAGALAAAPAVGRTADSSPRT